MQQTLSFLVGPEVAYKMHTLAQGLEAVEARHQAYFASQPSTFKAAGLGANATLVEFVQPCWQGQQIALFIAPTLPPAIVAECLACLQQANAGAVAGLGPTTRSQVVTSLRAFWARVRGKVLTARELPKD